MNSEPLISIILPTLNRSGFILEALNSIKDQTYRNWECLIIDDGSTDETSLIVTEFCKKDDRFTYHKRPGNFKKGVNGCRNYGLSLSTGDYIGFCDDDDFWMLDKLEKQVSIFKKYPQYGLVTGNVEFVNEDGVRTGRIIQQLDKNGYVFEEFLLKNRMSMITPLLKKESFDKVGVFNTDFSIFEDWEFWRRAAYYFEFYAIQEVLACVRKHDNNTSNVLTEDPLEQFVRYRRLTLATLEWGKAHFAPKEVELIKIMELKRYRQIMRNHCHGLQQKLEFLFIVFRHNFSDGYQLLSHVLKN